MCMQVCRSLANRKVQHEVGFLNSKDLQACFVVKDGYMPMAQEPQCPRTAGLPMPG
ncbi:hypothetical protein BofuT4_uP102310.1 [Botrytis cinerea T4]|uniref:Uncharacterized protein n=1 Tax=Botryotinia fuckeliana (strain T4) TaxID=999810 RepID=G2YBD9_BOTF4|nr:hypothetical protein BofuT4_uP102310.1 [Botrytis cinerea T4]